MSIRPSDRHNDNHAEIWSNGKAKRNGWEDGLPYERKYWILKGENKDSYPVHNQFEPAQFELRLKNAADYFMSRDIAEPWHQKLAVLKKDYCASLRDYQAACESETKESKEAEDAKVNLLAAQELKNEIKDPLINHLTLMTGLFFIAIAEISFNYYVFQLFQMGIIETIIVSMGIAIGIPIISHFLGKFLKKENKTTTDIVFTILIPIVVLLSITLLAYFRTNYLESQSLEIGSSLGITHTPLILMFLSINLILFLAATVLSYFGSHENPVEYNHRCKQLKEYEDKYDRESREDTAAKMRLKETHKYMIEAEGLIVNTFNEFKQQAKTLRKTYWLWVRTYRDYNTKARRDKDTRLIPCLHIDPCDPFDPRTCTPEERKYLVDKYEKEPVIIPSDIKNPLYVDLPSVFVMGIDMEEIKKCAEFESELTATSTVAIEKEKDEELKKLVEIRKKQLRGDV